MHKSNLWYSSLEEEVISLLYKLKRQDSSFQFNPVLSGNSIAGKKIKLGPSIYASKILKILNSNEFINGDSIHDWSNFINSFQKQKSNFPDNSFIDEGYLSEIIKLNFNNNFKNLIKKIILSVNKSVSFDTNEQKIINSVKAESKQAISTLFEFNMKNRYLYTDFPKKDSTTTDYLDSYNWGFPWNSGAQFAGQCLFTSTQLSEEEKLKNIQTLSRYIKTKLDEKTGFYFTGTTPSSLQLVNGAMKVLTGLQWIGEEIHHPEKIIDFCLNYTPNGDGCDLVDVIYVLSVCGKQSEYKKDEIIKYFDKMVYLIRNHHHPEVGGFSYYINKSQTHYYGLKISEGKNTPDLHGTLLLVWALAIIFDFQEDSRQSWNILRP